jgi:divalent metal cation (Fe/Co/Zn/Cd) transporter
MANNETLNHSRRFAMNIEELPIDTNAAAQTAAGCAVGAAIFYTSYHLGMKVSKKIKQRRADRKLAKAVNRVVESLDTLTAEIVKNEI